MVVTKQTADTIRDYLKVHYLRTRDHDQAIELLYGRDRPRDLYFDLYESSSRYIDQDWISRGLEYLCFEDTLQYVALPRLELTKKVQSVDSRFARVRSLLPDGEGRRDMVFLFDFLRKKGVSRILRVIVDDTTSPAHSDEAIEQALGGFRVEVWDWRKIDISIDTIISVALDVREVYLYWSGNNAVLRGWSDHGGLAQLKSLRTVHLHVSQVRREHEVMDEDVRVALIDDGVDIEEKTLRGKIIGGRSFCPRDYAQHLQRPFYVSGSGHGTVMASLICRVCPTAKLFVVKLAEHVSENSTRRITAKSAAKAVRAAIDRQAHIISMSWTIERNEQNAADIRDLEAAIGAAANAGILMFCAANDQGAALDVSFPAACANTKNIFKIGAAEASGAVWKWVGDAAAVDFIFPGHKVVKERPNDAPIDKCQTLTGSSVATAIASGLAALILYCVELSFVQSEAVNPPGKVDHFEGLSRHERMREAFLAIGTTQSSGNKYIEVWNVFEKAVEKSQGKPPDQFPAIVNEVANKLKARKMLE
ncbi:S8 family peptidase [Aspergillus brunneoviolaceus CBS 621.78]|uniref:Subtilisin-like protein n=1 Tax=Aspergillus brunneoviolaceus CBS 621.78 TaxID=1450534 RepID=A0ACD1FZZ1_9EURO|nr:subtilisin-like protein [Aspergillus brunneoviolaceus CBS 621.78]RAH42554.1 subtilisin-like protein [Aspergillus brunneoviolaceus CBS 621.78]